MKVDVYLLIFKKTNKFILAPEILIKYPNDFSDPILKSAANFAYPCQIPS
jgi:hypothetical protein